MANGNAKLIAESAPPPAKGAGEYGLSGESRSPEGDALSYTRELPRGNPDSPPRKKARRENEACLLAAGV